MPLSRSEFEEMRVEVARELVMRRNLYPRWVANGKMKQEQADERIRLMQKVYDWVVEQLPTTEKLI